jgi:hypothetical protein
MQFTRAKIHSYSGRTGSRSGHTTTIAGAPAGTLNLVGSESACGHGETAEGSRLVLVNFEHRI